MMKKAHKPLSGGNISGIVWCETPLEEMSDRDKYDFILNLDRAIAAQTETLARAQSLLRQAKEEIRHLRMRQEYLEPRSEAYGALIKILGMFHGPSQGYGVDVSWEIERFLQEQPAAADLPEAGF